MSNPIRLDVVPYGVKRHIAKVLDRTFRDMTIKPVHGYSEQNANINREVIVYERYKITILSESDNTDPNFAPWAVLETRSSGLGQLSDFTPIIAPNSFVEVEENENGEYTIIRVLPNVPSELARVADRVGQPASGHVPGSIVPTTGTKNGDLVSERPNTPEPSDEDEKQNKDNRTEDLLTACKKVNVEGINSELENLIRDVQDLKVGLTGSDSFLQTSNNFINQEILGRVRQASSKITEWTAWLVQEMRKYVLRKVNAAIGDLLGNAPLSTRYLIHEAKGETLNIISCLFVKILSNLENLIYQGLSALVNKILSTTTCLIENFIGNFIGQLLGQLTTLINNALGKVSSLIGSIIGFTTELLDFVIDILNILTCKVENICPQVEKWNPLNGPVPNKTTLDFTRVFESARNIANSFQGVLDIPEDIESYNFNFDVGSALRDTLNDCNVGPKSCGLPNVVFFGGIGSGASGNAVVNAVGNIIGVDIVTPGNYSRAPVISFEDDCGKGFGATGLPVLGSVTTGEDGTDTGADIGTDGVGTDDTDDTDGTTGIGITNVVITNTGYDYYPYPDGSKGGAGRVFANRCQTIVQRANGDYDAVYSEGNVIQLYYGDKITLPGSAQVVIDCDFNASELPGCIENGEKYCYKDMSDFDDGSGYYLKPLNIKSMIGFDDTRGSRPELVYPVSIEHQRVWDELRATERANELFEEDRRLVEQGLLVASDFGRPDQFGYHQDYPYAKELGFSDTDIRFYLEGFYLKLLGKRLGPLMKLKLEDPNFGPLPKRISGRGGAGLFDCDNDYPYALSLGFNDRDIRYYLENIYTGQIDDCMQAKLNDSNWGRVDYYVQLTAPGCPPDEQPTGDYDVISEVGDVYVDNGGFGYSPDDTATILDCSGNPSTAQIELVLNQDGTIIDTRIINPGSGFTCIPEITINTRTGYNANLIPVLSFRRLEEFAEVPAGTEVLQVIDCVGRV